jgi:hypothetical protein
MERVLWFVALALPLLAATAANGEITKAVMGVRGAEMS